MLIRQHVPTYFDGIEPEEAHFETLDELLSVPFVMRWQNRELARFSHHPYYDDRGLLIAEMCSGAYWVVGYFGSACDGPDLGLPEWIAPSAQEKQ